MCVEKTRARAAARAASAAPASGGRLDSITPLSGEVEGVALAMLKGAPCNARLVRGLLEAVSIVCA
jgi:hypothetical protein